VAIRIALIAVKSTFIESPWMFGTLGLWYLWPILEAAGHECQYFALDGDELPTEGFDRYLVSGTSPQAFELRRVGDVLRAHGCRTIVGGAHATMRPDDLVGHYDVVVKGEGEEIVLDALDAPPGTVLSPSRPADITRLPLPVRKAQHRFRYPLPDNDGSLHWAAHLFTSRGCPMRCDFCETGRFSKIWPSPVRYEPVAKVVQQIEEIVGATYWYDEQGQAHLFDALMFYDDIFPLNKHRTLALLDEMRRIHHATGMIWRCFMRVDVIAKHGGQAYLQQMYDAGLREVLCGVESGSQRILDIIHKGTTVEENTLARKWCKEIGLRFKASTILGLPGEDRESMEATRRWLFDNLPDRVDVNIYIPFLGTPLTDSILRGERVYDLEIVEPGLHTDEFWYSGKNRATNALCRTSSLSRDEIFEFRNRLMAELEAIYGAREAVYGSHFRFPNEGQLI